jgi:acrylyl-CoA reductase (NADPH)
MAKVHHFDAFHFMALTVCLSRGSISLSLQETELTKVSNRDVIIKVLHSSINYKDKLICAGNPGLVRRFPHVAGIDAVGEVVSPNAAKFLPGDNVMVIATPLGVKCAGGFAEYIKVPEDWVMSIPDELSAKDVAIIGTAGFTAALALLTLEKYETLKSNGPILITGASGGVGLLAAFLLLARGYQVELVSSDPTLAEFFVEYEGASFISYDEFLNQKSFPLLKSKYAGAIDNVGGGALSIAARSLNPNAKICAIGMAASEKIDMSIMPLIQRGIHIIGINAEATDDDTRRDVWNLISETRSQLPLEKVSKECSLQEACVYLKGEKYMPGHGRILVNV